MKNKLILFTAILLPLTAKQQIDLPTAVQKLNEAYPPAAYYGKSEDYRGCKFWFQVDRDANEVPTQARMVLHVVKEWSSPEEKIQIVLNPNDAIFFEGTQKSFVIRRSETPKDGVFERKRSLRIEPHKDGGNVVSFYNSHPAGGQPTSLLCRFK